MKRFTCGVQDAVLDSALSTTFGSLTAILAPVLGHPRYEVMSMVAPLGEIEGRLQAKD